MAAADIVDDGFDDMDEADEVLDSEQQRLLDQAEDGTLTPKGCAKLMQYLADAEAKRKKGMELSDIEEEFLAAVQPFAEV